MSLVTILIFLNTLQLLCGIYQFYWVHITKKGYILFSEPKESLYSFCIRYYAGIWEKLKTNQIFRKFVNTGRLFKFRTIIGVFMTFTSVLIYLGTYLLAVDETYGVFVNLKL